MVRLYGSLQFELNNKNEKISMNEELKERIRWYK